VSQAEAESRTAASNVSRVCGVSRRQEGFSCKDKPDVLLSTGRGIEMEDRRSSTVRSLSCCSGRLNATRRHSHGRYETCLSILRPAQSHCDHPDNSSTPMRLGFNEDTRVGGIEDQNPPRRPIPRCASAPQRDRPRSAQRAAYESRGNSRWPRN
jgi:hypothetical protein